MAMAETINSNSKGLKANNEDEHERFMEIIKSSFIYVQMWFIICRFGFIRLRFQMRSAPRIV